MPRRDVAHLALMGFALALSYALPFELLLLSYAILGPAHYLTEISWLHDRGFFMGSRGMAWGMALLVLVLVFLASPAVFGAAVWCVFLACAALAKGSTWPHRAALAAVAAPLTWLFAANGLFPVVGILMPTLVHVSLFTLLFMASGALRSRSPSQGLLVACYVAGIAALALVPPGEGTTIPALARLGQEFFSGVAPALGRVLGIPDLALDARLTGILGFVYTYHYLNWFIKSDVIRWSDVPPSRLALIASASVGSTGLYFHDFLTGFIVLFALSLMHVVLEFPLNSLSIRDLGTLAVRALAPRRA